MGIRSEGRMMSAECRMAEGTHARRLLFRSALCKHHSARAASYVCGYAFCRGLSVPNTGMAVTIDVGDPLDIHYKDKFDVGQRLALARALLKPAPILLLDEATSALDSSSELAVQSGLLERARGRTTIVVAHRLSTVMGFDRTIVLQGGEIIEDGTPRQLRNGRGPFAQMWATQSRVGEIAREPAA